MQALQKSTAQATSRRAQPPPMPHLREPDFDIKVIHPYPYLERIMQVDIAARMYAIALTNGRQKPTIQTVRQEVDMFLSAENPHVERMAELAKEHLKRECEAKGIMPRSEHLFDLFLAVLEQDTSGVRVQRLRTALVHGCWNEHIPGMIGSVTKAQDPETAQAVRVFLHIMNIANYYVESKTGTA